MLCLRVVKILSENAFSVEEYFSENENRALRVKFLRKNKSNMKMFVFWSSEISEPPESFHLLHISDLLSVNKSNVNIWNDGLYEL